MVATVYQFFQQNKAIEFPFCRQMFWSETCHIRKAIHLPFCHKLVLGKTVIAILPRVRSYRLVYNNLTILPKSESLIFSVCQHIDDLKTLPIWWERKLIESCQKLMV